MELRNEAAALEAAKRLWHRERRASEATALGQALTAALAALPTRAATLALDVQVV